MKLKVLIVDNEELARHLIREYLASEAEVEIIAECANGFDAVKAIQDLQPEHCVSGCSDAEVGWV